MNKKEKIGLVLSILSTGFFMFWIGFGMNVDSQTNTPTQTISMKKYLNDTMTLSMLNSHMTNMLEDLVGTNETKQEFVDHYCKRDNGFPMFGFQFCQDVIKNGAGYLGFNQTGGFLSQ